MNMLKSFLNAGPSPREKELEATLKALDKSMARIEFSMDGKVLDANDNFLDLMGYRLDEVKGKHHSIFITPDFRESEEYSEFWRILNQGKFHQAEYQRVGKGGREIWIQASYNPIVDERGVPFKVVKYATDITERVHQDRQNKLNADSANALKVCQANVMLADNNMNILYVNDSLVDMLNAREDTIRKELKNFSVSSLVGTCVDVFHAKPEHQRRMVSALKDPYITRLKISGLTFSLTATPWIDISGERIGTVVEWEDVTDALARQEEEREIANENARVKQALDVVATNAMIANNDLDIVYLNNSVTAMLKNAEADLKKSCHRLMPVI